MSALPKGSVVGVVVTRHRRELLAHSLKVLASQTRPLDHLVVVDNGPDQPVDDLVAQCPIPTTYLASHRNLGGAGGFALGMLHALSLGADWLWLADDDGRPADETVLATLLDVAERRRLAAVSPVVANIDRPEKLAFPLRRGLTWKRRTEELGTDFLPGIASLFNGALFRASTVDVAQRIRSLEKTGDDGKIEKLAEGVLRFAETILSRPSFKPWIERETAFLERTAA